MAKVIDTFTTLTLVLYVLHAHTTGCSTVLKICRKEITYWGGEEPGEYTIFHILS